MKEGREERWATVTKRKLPAEISEGAREEWPAMNRNQLQCFTFNVRTLHVLCAARGSSDLVANQLLVLIIKTKMHSLLKCKILV